MKKIVERIRELMENKENVKGLIRDNKDMLMKAAAIAAVIVVAFFVFVLKGGEERVKPEENLAAVETEVSTVYVDIGGAVNTPMVAELEEGSRVEDAIKAAGGLTEDADLTDINRAAFVNDGDKIFIPQLAEEADEGLAMTGGSGGYGDGKININTADSTQLQEITGVGPATAQKIIDYREENGRFGSVDDIKNVSGIGEKTFEKLKEEIRV